MSLDASERNLASWYLAASDLNEGDPLPEGDEVSRYCKPTAFDLDLSEPTVLAFMRNENELDVSVFRIEFYVGCTRSSAVDYIRSEFGKQYTLRPKGRFVVFNVNGAKEVGRKKEVELGFVYSPKPGLPSHSSIVNLPEDYDEEVRLATALLRLVTQDDVYPAVL